MGGRTPGPNGMAQVGQAAASVLGQATTRNPLLPAASHGPKLLLVGEPAMQAVAQILPTAHPITVPSALGEVLLRPGAVWSGNRMLVYAAPLYVYYTIDDRLYEWSTTQFIRDEWFDALARGAGRAEWLVAVGKAEMALLVGLLVPWYVLLGVSCAKLGIFYATHKSQVESATQDGKRMLELLQKLRREHPALFDKLLRKAARDLIQHLPEGITGEDVGFFLGRVLKGVDALPAITLKAVARVVLVVAVLVGATHLPSVAAHVIEKAAKDHALELQARLRAAGITVTPAEAEVILRDAFAKPDLEATLRELETVSKSLVPSLEELNKALIPTK